MSHEDNQALLAVHGALVSRGIHEINFCIGPVTVNPNTFHAVRVALGMGRIHVVYDTSIPEEAEAQYLVASNQIRMRSTTLSTDHQKGLVVHESVHAWCDMMNYRQMGIGEAESLAYVAQALYARANWGERIGYPPRWNAGEPIFALAWDLAGIIRSGRTPSGNQYGALAAAVRRHPFYAHASPAFDGVPE